MKRCIMLFALLSFLVPVSTASADWRWATPTFKKRTVTYSCSTMKCIRDTYLKEKKRYKRMVARHNQRRLKEWKHWTNLFIPDCTWYGESGTGPEYARSRYTMPNSTGSGAYGKFQFMLSTYSSVAKYHDWSPLDQEIAARREYWKNGIYPWENCTN